MAAQPTAAVRKRLRDLGLSAADRNQIAALVQEQAFRRGEVIVREGDPGTELYIVDTGVVEVSAAGRVLNRLGPGEWFGEMALLTGAKRSATVEVVLDCRVLVLEAEGFARLLTLQPSLYARLAAILSRRLAHALQVTHPCSQVVLVDNRAGWPNQRAVVEDLAAALERELAQDVAIVSVAHRARPSAPERPSRLDAVLTTSPKTPDRLRARLTAQLTAFAHFPVVLVEVAAGLEIGAALAYLADVVLVLADAGTTLPLTSPRQRRIALYDRRRGSTPALCDASAAVLADDERWRSWAIDHVARIVTHRTVGIALGSGVAYGLANLGVLAALEEAGIPIDFIAGSSIGSIVGAGYALGTSATALCTTVERLAGLRSARAVLQTIGLLARDANLMRPGLLAGDRLLAFLDTVAPVPRARFDDLVIPFRAVATDLTTGERVEICDGALSDALRASASAPWLLSPWRVGNRVLIDGGMCDPVPCTTVRRMGADRVIAVNVVPPLDPRAQSPLTKVLGAIDWLNPLSYLEGSWRLPNSFDVVMKSLLILQHELGNSRVGEADVLINPSLGEFWFLEFWSAPALIAKGAAAARDVIPTIRQKLRPEAFQPTAFPAAAVPAS